MGIADNLKRIITMQKAIVSELEAEQQILENSDLAQKNAALSSELDKLRADFEEINSNATTLADDNKNLKNALYEQIYNEKIKIVNNTEQKLDLYFRAYKEGELNRLTDLENTAKARIDGIRAQLKQNNVDIKDDIYAQLDGLAILLDYKVTEARANAARIPGAFTQQERDELESLKSEQINDEQLRAVTKKNNLERFVGLNVLNTIGILLLVIGAITLARFTYAYLSDLLKGIMLFALGGVMLAAGELLNRKKPNIFSLGLSAGGIAILFAALATSYFGLEILDMYPAIILCALITAGAFILSNRYKSQTIAVFALIGGYLPLFSISPGSIVIYGAMIYFVVLNVFALMISFSKKWRIASFVGLFLNIIGAVYICSYFNYENKAPEKLLAILYVLFAFIIYTSIPIIGTYRTKTKFRRLDIILLAINTLASSLIIFNTFYRFELQDYNGLVAAAFAAIYLFLGWFMEKKFAGEESGVRVLFYLTGLVFVVLIVPMQFGRAWLSLGWLAEGVLLAGYGVIYDEKSFRKAGFVISLLCLGAFLLVDCLYIEHYMFVYKYLAITLGSLIILGAYMYKKMMSGRFVKIYKYFALINAWFFILYIIGNKLRGALSAAYGSGAIYQIDYLINAASIVATFAIAYSIRRIKLLSDTGIKVMSAVLYTFGIIWLLLVNAYSNPVSRVYFRTDTPAFGITLVGTVILIVLGGLSIFATRDLVKMLVSERRLGVEWYPLIVSGYFVIILTQNLIVQYRLDFSSVAISIIYVLAAFAWIVFGFARRFSFIRKFGLGLALLSVVKLFLIDLASLAQGYRIVSYFALGISLLAISFVYQYFSKRLELREGITDDVKKDN